MIWSIYEELNKNPLIKEKVEDRIKFYEYPETGEVDNPVIIIDPLSTPRPTNAGDDERIVYEYLYQIDVWSNSYHDTEQLMKATSDILFDMGFIEQGGGVDEYDQKIYRRAKRFVGRFENI